MIKSRIKTLYYKVNLNKSILLIFRAFLLIFIALQLYHKLIVAKFVISSSKGAVVRLCLISTLLACDIHRTTHPKRRPSECGALVVVLCLWHLSRLAWHLR